MLLYKNQSISKEVSFSIKQSALYGYLLRLKEKLCTHPEAPEIPQHCNKCSIKIRTTKL